MTMILSPLEFEHLVQVVRHAAGGHRAECLCGWASRWTDDLAAADNAASGHRRQIDQVSGTDATIAALLDLQDDLADAIMWLAEYWRPDLPALRARSCTDDCMAPTGQAWPWKPSAEARPNWPAWLASSAAHESATSNPTRPATATSAPCAASARSTSSRATPLTESDRHRPSTDHRR